MVRSIRLVTAALLTCVYAVSTLHALSRYSPEDEARFKETGSCASCSLTGANLQGVNGENGQLTSADLSGANLYMANLRGANLTGASLNGANLNGAQMIGATGADFTGAITDTRTQCPSGAAGPCS